MPTLNWIGKDAVVTHHKDVPFRLLEPVPALSCGEPDSGNLIVQGDNLLALKALLPRYAGQVKCIYIDPPYNTGNEGWAYNDNVNSPEIRRWLGEVVGKEGETLDRHDRWLCMMYPRLALLKQFLREDGAIFVSIDDNEVANLRLLMDEVFGRHRFVACNVWQKRYSRENRGAIGDVHEYLVVYAMNPERFQAVRNRVPIDEKQAAVYKNPNKDPRGRWRGIPMTAQGYRPNQMYEIESPSGRKLKPPEGRCWSTVEGEFLKLKSEGRIYFGKSGGSQPSVIRYLSEVEGFVPWTWWPHDEVGHTDEARKEVQAIFGTQTAFDTPKPTRLIQRILQIATKPGEIVLDSFAGSGTTGHAVLKANAEDGGNRRFILVEMDENIARNVTAERVKRVAHGYTNAKGEKVEGLGGGFQFCKLGQPLFDARGHIDPGVRFAELARFVWFMETGMGLPVARASKQKADTASPLLGVHEGRAVYLLYNGILKDRSIDGGNVLTTPLLQQLPPHPGRKVVYAARCAIGAERLRVLGISFKQLPYDLRVAP
ncbi:site-specific DNA-methyltransferase [Sinimarinibacterium flocculans]|uniref:site-specific DNA-methyltransferase n=1 Tax=Sinimarinibacterium flocculans TaxID=985250 RepID=UPI002491B2B4|nr:site-specific DNA-methyltransferase [Sinimarinibacterium flocculans]